MLFVTLAVMLLLSEIETHVVGKSALNSLKSTILGNLKGKKQRF